MSDDAPEPEQPHVGGFCEDCGHYAYRHSPDGCIGVNRPRDGRLESESTCRCAGMLWMGVRWPRPWLPAPEGLLPEELPEGSPK